MDPAPIHAELLFADPPFPHCHASTIAETNGGLVAACFGGSHESHPDVGIWLSRHEHSGWTQAVEVANGAKSTGERYPSWNPVLFQPRDKPLLLFYKVGPNPREWWGLLRRSDDGGKTWSAAERLPEGILGPIKNKPIQLENGALLCPSSTEHDGWRVHVERTSDLGTTWERTEALNDGVEFSAIQPSILRYPGGRLQLLSRSRQNVITECWSEDGGQTWGAMTATTLRNPNAGTDAVTLSSGLGLLVYNHTVRGGPGPIRREMLNVAVTEDGKKWQAALLLENDRSEFSYPAVIQTRDGRVHVTYTYRRRNIKHVVIDPGRLQPRDFDGGRWPEV